ncbi:MAG: (2Fe-2S) ferredoxin domain-containing protein [Spirochaetaceae bacterium]|nr:MAG: (2Fe-2S) ferredoxin domain-containing protein [Spirochaetaceae bacterium]
MTKPQYQILVCAGFRVSGEAQGACAKKGATALLPYLEEELADRDIGACVVTATGCLNLCEQGPVVVVQPANAWYGKVATEDDIDIILDALENQELSSANRLDTEP